MKLEDVSDQDRWRVIIAAVLNRLPRYHLGDDREEYGRRLRTHVGVEVRKLWEMGLLPHRTGKRWIAGLAVDCIGESQSVGAGRSVGPKPPSRHRPRYTIVRVQKGWDG